MARRPEPEFTWRHYLLGNNMIAGTLQTFGLIFFVSLAFALISTWTV